MGVIGTALGAAADNYHSLKTARIVAGFATTAYESVVIATISDMHCRVKQIDCAGPRPS
jgi:predicted MFS family arabinose efflux permease